MLTVFLTSAAGIVLSGLSLWLAGVRYIPHHKVGVVERLWSPRGSLTDGHIVALEQEAGFQADLLRGGLHLGYWGLAWRVHAVSLVTVPEGELGYVYARDGRPLALGQTLGRVVPCNDFQDARAFLQSGGQRGRQRAVLREGVYAVNLGQFVVLTSGRIHAGPLSAGLEQELRAWQEELARIDGYRPVVIGVSGDSADVIGIVTVHDGPALDPGEIIAAEVADHGCFQDPERFLAVGGRRGRQLQAVEEPRAVGDHWFATVELARKTVIPIGYVGVVVSYHGEARDDVTGERFRYGVQVEQGGRGVWRDALPPGKYALNPYAQKVELVPTVNFVLRWVTGQVEPHEYDKDLQSIELITADGFEPKLPLSLVLHIDYEKAPRVVQRFGDVNRLISQTLDPILSAYFRDVAQNCSMLDLLTRREEIQRLATEELGRRFREFDINCVAVMIGRPESVKAGPEDPIDHLFAQLRQRRLAEEQIATFVRQEQAAVQQRSLHRVQAEAEEQTELTRAEMHVQIATQRAEAALAETKRRAKGQVATALGDARATRIRGRADAETTARVGLAQAEVAQLRARALGDARLVALIDVAAQLARSQQPLVPERLVATGGEPAGTLPSLVTMLLAERSGVPFAGDDDLSGMVSAVAANAEGQDDVELQDRELDEALEA
ncbi:MAG: SPFH domain-containing protein [Myxococcota bacterium]